MIGGIAFSKQHPGAATKARRYIPTLHSSNFLYLHPMQPYRLDRTAFRIQTFAEAAHQRAYWLTHTPRERLTAAWYLICAAYNLNRSEPQRLDKTVFSMRKQIV